MRSAFLGGRYGCFFLVVHFAGTVLARGIDCIGALPHRLAAASAIPNCRDSRERRSQAFERPVLPSGSSAARA